MKFVLVCGGDVKISKNSVYYKCLNFFFSHPAKNICQLFWQTVWTFIGAPFVFLFIMTVFGIPVVAIFFENMPKYISLPLSALIGTIVISLGSLFILGIFWILLSLSDLFKKPLNNPVSKVIGSYFKAKKGKYCSKVDYID